jgi:hypothetical protein
MTGYQALANGIMHSDLMLQACVQRRFDGLNSRCFAIDYALLNSDAT